VNCKKNFFSSKKLAKSAIKRRQKGRRKIKCRVYKCRLCGGYHYTSMTAKAIQEMKDRL